MPLKKQKSGTSPHLLLCDIKLPFGMNCQVASILTWLRAFHSFAWASLQWQREGLYTAATVFQT